MPFDEPYKRVRDTVRFLRAALTRGEGRRRVRDVHRAGLPPGTAACEQPPPIYVAALRPGMLRLAGREADGAIINWLSADDVATVVAEVGPGKEIVARIFVCPTEDAERARFVGRIGIAAYLNVAVYAAFHRWLGGGPLLEEMWAAWRRGTARRPWPPSPTRWSTPWWSTARPRSAVPTCSATSTTGSPSPSWPCSPGGTTWPRRSRTWPRGGLSSRVTVGLGAAAPSTAARAVSMSGGGRR